MSGLTRPALLVAIDTEGDNQWDVAARRHQTFENLYALGRLHEFFDGDTGHGLGADEQAGWTALVANLIRESWPATPTTP